ncbi:hypothetical protein PPERSA_12223 [Pseudocohnilembus persalinus]|uniref:Uncharacterized protein n=1 Tax=Pseudocohnilembus persalinus TaxID=266149 RepID=A0A0V0R9H6_PSEPJ|nr:hypothetical protein PPERSA_12223 [Pseudocohnilembus persalinus]|eukprot:KRX10872.1 hypothetical protein PPERSA_12223 [Pseudocohnilembus persalinus]
MEEQKYIKDQCQVCFEEINQDKTCEYNSQNLNLKNVKKICKCQICNNCQTSWQIENILSLKFDMNFAQFRCGSCRIIRDLKEFQNQIQNDKENSERILHALMKKYAFNTKDIMFCPKQNCDYICFINLNEEIDCFECQKCEVYMVDIK